MSNGIRNLDEPTESEKAMATALITVAGAIFAGVFVLLAMFPGLSSTGQRWANIVIGLILIALAVSMFFGGRGFMYGPKRLDWLDRFNLQTAFGVLAVVLIIILAGIIFLTTEPSQSEKLVAGQTALETRVKDLTEKLDNMQKDLAVQFSGISNKVGVISNDISDLKSKADVTQKKLDDLSQITTNHSNNLKSNSG